MTAGRRDWTRAELLPVFALYLRTPFGRLHAGNPDVIALSGALGRTPAAVAFKLTNIASCDPDVLARGRVGLSHAARLERDLFAEFLRAPSVVVEAAVPAYDAAMACSGGGDATRFAAPPGATEREAVVMVRRRQAFFREAVLAGYVRGCAMCDVAAPDFLVAAHIIPWAVDETRRVDPRNGMAMCGIHDRAFETGVVAVDDRYRVQVAPAAAGRGRLDGRVLTAMVLELEGSELRLPERMPPDRSALAWHREHRFGVGVAAAGV